MELTYALERSKVHDVSMVKAFEQSAVRQKHSNDRFVRRVCVSRRHWAGPKS